MSEPQGITFDSFFGKLVARLREVVTDSIRFWEWRRLVYNGALTAIVIGHFIAGLPDSSSALTFDLVLFLFVLAVLANLCYCAAYPIDIFVQLSGLRETWRKWRWVLLVIGIAIAGIFARWFCLGVFLGPHGW